MPKKTAGVYARASEIDAEPSLMEQFALARSFAKAQGFEIKGTFQDYGPGASEYNRNGLSACIEGAIAGEFNFILLANRSTMFDDLVYVFSWQDFLWRHAEVDLIFLDDMGAMGVEGAF